MIYCYFIMFNFYINALQEHSFHLPDKYDFISAYSSFFIIADNINSAFNSIHSNIYLTLAIATLIVFSFGLFLIFRFILFFFHKILIRNLGDKNPVGISDEVWASVINLLAFALVLGVAAYLYNLDRIPVDIVILGFRDNLTGSMHFFIHDRLGNMERFLMHIINMSRIIGGFTSMPILGVIRCGIDHTSSVTFASFVANSIGGSYWISANSEMFSLLSLRYNFTSMGHSLSIINEGLFIYVLNI